MNRLITAGVAIVAVLLATVGHAEEPAYMGRYDSTPEDVNAILQLTTDFRAALAEKNVKQLSTMMFNSNVLFASPASPTTVKMMADKEDVHFDGVPAGGFVRFAQFIRDSRVPLEEKFYNVKVTQDGHVAWVTFDFEFLQDAKVVNHGLEVWQVLKTPGEKWKILSVVWSSHGSPK